MSVSRRSLDTSAGGYMVLDFSDLAISVSELPPTTWVDVLLTVLLAISIIVPVFLSLIRELRYQKHDDQYIP